MKFGKKKAKWFNLISQFGRQKYFIVSVCFVIDWFLFFRPSILTAVLIFFGKIYLRFLRSRLKVQSLLLANERRGIVTSLSLFSILTTLSPNLFYALLNQNVGLGDVINLFVHKLIYFHRN